jgi:hypothetical protein
MNIFTKEISYILDVLNLQDDDKLPLNSLHILEECNIPTIRCSQDKHKIDGGM